MKFIFLLVISFLFISCGCSDEGFESFELNPFEKTVIPFNSPTTKEFLNNDLQIITATISAKTVDNFNSNASDDESCFVSLLEQQECMYEFSNSSKIYYVKIIKGRFGYTEFFIYDNNQEFYGIQDLETQNLEEELTDISIDEFEFSDIFLFTSNNQEAEFEKIVYSAERGIEFIKYRNGNYIKLQ